MGLKRSQVRGSRLIDLWCTLGRQLTYFFDPQARPRRHTLLHQVIPILDHCEGVQLSFQSQGDQLFCSQLPSLLEQEAAHLLHADRGRVKLQQGDALAEQGTILITWQRSPHGLHREREGKRGREEDRYYVYYMRVYLCVCVCVCVHSESMFKLNYMIYSIKLYYIKHYIKLYYFKYMIICVCVMLFATAREVI